MTLLSPTAMQEYDQAKKRLYECEEALRLANEHMKEVINRHNINHQPRWPGDERVNTIGQNGNTGEHYNK